MFQLAIILFTAKITKTSHLTTIKGTKLNQPMSFEIIYINSSSETVQKAYKNICYANQLEKHRLFKSCNCDFLNLRTNEDYTLNLIQFFQRRLK